MISQQHSELAESAFARLSGSLNAVASLEGPKLPRLLSKREWQGQTRLRIGDYLKHLQGPWRPSKLRAVDNALKKYSKERIRCVRRADSFQQKLQKLIDSGTDIGTGHWKRKLKKLLDAKGRELKAYERAVEAAKAVSNRYDDWRGTNDFKFRGQQMRPRAVRNYEEQFGTFVIEEGATQLETCRSKLKAATDGYQRAQRELRSQFWAGLRSVGSSLLRLDPGGTTLDVFRPNVPDSLLQTPSHLRESNPEPMLHAPTARRPPLSPSLSPSLSRSPSPASSLSSLTSESSQPPDRPSRPLPPTTSQLPAASPPLASRPRRRHGSDRPPTPLEGFVSGRTRSSPRHG